MSLTQISHPITLGIALLFLFGLFLLWRSRPLAVQALAGSLFLAFFQTAVLLYFDAIDTQRDLKRYNWPICYASGLMGAISTAGAILAAFYLVRGGSRYATWQLLVATAALGLLGFFGVLTSTITGAYAP
jgi:hypothetical protein